MNVVMPDFPDTVRLNSRLKAKFFINAMIYT